MTIEITASIIFAYQGERRGENEYEEYDEESGELVYAEFPDAETALDQGDSFQLWGRKNKTVNTAGGVSESSIALQLKVTGFNYIGNPFPAEIDLQDVQMDESIADEGADLQVLDKEGATESYYNWYKKDDETGKAGMGRTDTIWNEMNVIGVTDGIYNDTVAVTTSETRPEIHTPEFINAMQQSLINIINTEEGQAIFSVYSHTGYAIATDADYDASRKALTALQ